MKPFELLPHTSEAKFRAYGNTVEEAFANAVRALTAISTDEDVAQVQEKNIEIEGSDLKNLLFNLIDELIFLIDTQDFIAAHAEVRIEKNDSYVLHATLAGDDVRKYGSSLKAPTYSDMIVKEENSMWIAQAVVDI